MTIQRIFPFIILLLTSFTTIAQTCDCCDGLGVVYEREYVTEYDNLTKGTTSGWNAKDVYTYTNKRNVRKTIEKKCSCCGGSGNQPQRTRRATPQRKEPTIRYVTASEMLQMSLHKFKQGFENLENLGGGYYYAKFKHKPYYYVLAKVYSTELGYDVELRYIKRRVKEYDKDGNFKYYCFSNRDESFYYDKNLNFQFQTGGPSSYLGFDDLFWLKKGEQATLMQFPQNTTMFYGDFQTRSPSDSDAMLEEAQLWQDHKLLFARNNDLLGVINHKGEYIIPPLFSNTIVKFNTDTQIFELLNRATDIYHYFNVDGQEILVQPKLFKTCDNGDEIYEYTRNVYVKNKKGSRPTLQKGKVYELKAKEADQGLPPYYQYCSCYNEDGVAKVVKFNTQDTILADIYGKTIDQEAFAALKGQTSDIPLFDEEKELLRMIKEAYSQDIKVKQINGKNKFACDDYKNGEYVFDELVPFYLNSINAFAAKKKDGYIIFQHDKDLGYNWIKSTYQNVDIGATDGNIIPVQNKKGKWGAVFLSGTKKKLKQVIAPKYDRFECFFFENKNRSTFALFNGNAVTWIRTNVWNKRETKKIPYKEIEEKTEFKDHIRWLKKSNKLRAFTVLSLFKYYDVDPKKEVLSYWNDGPIHLINIGEGYQRLWNPYYQGEQFKVSEDIVSAKLTKKTKRIVGIQEYLDLHLEVKYKDGQTKSAKMIYLKDQEGYKADKFEE